MDLTFGAETRRRHQGCFSLCSCIGANVDDPSKCENLPAGDFGEQAEAN